MERDDEVFACNADKIGPFPSKVINISHMGRTGRVDGGVRGDSPYQEGIAKTRFALKRRRLECQKSPDKN